MQKPVEGHVTETVDHLFRHEAGKMVAVITKKLGFNNIEQARDIVQDTIVAALETWKYDKMPANPQAWLYCTAKNKLADFLRHRLVEDKAAKILFDLFEAGNNIAEPVVEIFAEDEIKDSQLRMMFACCHGAFSKQSQVCLMLNTLCGLSAREIADAFLTQEEAVQKRLYRTKEKIRKQNITLEYPGAEAMPAVLHAVLKTLYLLFNEGYNSSHPKKLIREELCMEAMRLTILLTENPRTNLPAANALLALMCFQASRFGARMGDKGYIILLKEQDRSRWNQFLIQQGNEYLACSASGRQLHEFHIEAGIASIHANTPCYEQTDWRRILALYDALITLTGNPVAALNRCLVIGELEGGGRGLNELHKLQPLEDNCYYYASLGEMYTKTGRKIDGRICFEKALALTQSGAEKQLINHKIALTN